MYADAEEISGTATPNSYIVFLSEGISLMETSVDGTGAFRLPATNIAPEQVIKAIVYSDRARQKYWKNPSGPFSPSSQKLLRR